MGRVVFSLRNNTTYVAGKEKKGFHTKQVLQNYPRLLILILRSNFMEKRQWEIIEKKQYESVFALMLA